VPEKGGGKGGGQKNKGRIIRDREGGKEKKKGDFFAKGRQAEEKKKRGGDRVISPIPNALLSTGERKGGENHNCPYS